MRVARRTTLDRVEGDMTPMIDMTFQLIAFFMVVINFSEVEQDQRVKLPLSELARPPDTAYEEPVTIQMTADETILFRGREMGIEELRVALRQETIIMKSLNDGSFENATVVIRADLSARSGKAQEIIKACQDVGLDTFALRGQQSDETTLGQ